VERDERFRGPDDIAGKLVPFLPKLLFLKCAPLRKLLIRRIMPRGIYEYVLARTELFDRAFRDAVLGGFSQIVILGAGFDTRAVRFHDGNRDTAIFELDAPITQQAKIEQFEKKGVEIPEEVTFVPIDFDKEDMAEKLYGAGYRNDCRTLFMMEGVTMYLSENGVTATLESIRDNSATGSMIVFDYIEASVLRREDTLYGEKDIYRITRDNDEGWTFGIEEGEIETFLSERGFRLAEHYTPAELQRIFLTAEDGTVYGKINGTHSIALAATTA
jgi:methyltransferase (TIGR00027 family)